jgi:hypothetical protein
VRGGRCSPRAGGAVPAGDDGGGPGGQAGPGAAGGGAPNMERPGADLIAHYLDPGRRRWSRRHADTQARLCRWFAVPVIAGVACQDITPARMQLIVNAAPTAGEGDRLHRCLPALVSAGIEGGYLASPQLARVR